MGKLSVLLAIAVLFTGCKVESSWYRVECFDEQNKLVYVNEQNYMPSWDEGWGKCQIVRSKK